MRQWLLEDGCGVTCPHSGRLVNLGSLGYEGGWAVPKARERINILGRSWRVHFVRSAIKLKDGTVCDGHADQDRHLIRVSLGMAKDRQRSTLLHELLHAVIDTTTSVHHADEEKCVQALESGLFPVLRAPENKWAIDFLLEP